MVQELETGILRGVTGTVHYHPVFEALPTEAWTSKAKVKTSSTSFLEL